LDACLGVCWTTDLATCSAAGFATIVAAFKRDGNGQVRALRLHGREEARGEVKRQRRHIARGAQQEWRGAVAQAGFQASERAGKASGLVGPHRHAKRGVRVEVLVGVDGNGGHLWRQPFEHVRSHRLAAQRLQALVDMAHA
jgi:hypothetical protein